MVCRVGVLITIKVFPKLEMIGKTPKFSKLNKTGVSILFGSLLVNDQCVQMKVLHFKRPYRLFCFVLFLSLTIKVKYKYM